MSAQTVTSEYMVLCRGFSWDESLSPEDRQNVEKKFYDWFDRLANEGKIIKRGHRLAREGKVLSGRKALMDGPFPESKEAIAGYWIIQAESLEEAVEIRPRGPSSGLWAHRRATADLAGCPEGLAARFSFLCYLI